MKLIKTTTQSTELASETLYIIKGIFRKRVYMVAYPNLLELKRQDVPDEEKTT
jgi:hypothetical protein